MGVSVANSVFEFVPSSLVELFAAEEFVFDLPLHPPMNKVQSITIQIHKAKRAFVFINFYSFLYNR